MDGYCYLLYPMNNLIERIEIIINQEELIDTVNRNRIYINVF